MICPADSRGSGIGRGADRASRRRLIGFDPVIWIAPRSFRRPKRILATRSSPIDPRAPPVSTTLPMRPVEAVSGNEDNAHADARAQLEALYREHGRRVFALARRYCGDDSEAADLTHETFVRAFQALPSFRDRLPHVGWLCRVLVNLCIDRRRRRDRWERLEPALGDAVWPVGRETDPPDQSADRGRTRLAVLDALQQLSDHHRMVIVLREFGSFEYSEIARMMRCRRGTVMSRLFHACRRLRALLETSLGGAVPLRPMRLSA